jgi:CBS-domain-containing membrane protein
MRDAGARNLGLWAELALAVPPAVTVLAAIYLVEALRVERVLFASLASSAFLIYRDPAHPMNGVRVMVPAHLAAVACGVGTAWLLGPGYAAGATAMIATGAAIVLLRAVHPPAVSTALGFAFYAQQRQAVGVFLLALALLAALVALQRVMGWLFGRLSGRARPGV